MATKAEQSRPAMEDIPSTVGQGELTVQEIQQGVAKMRLRKTCGPDAIPIEVFKSCPKCYLLLQQLLQKIWATEQVPVRFA